MRTCPTAAARSRTTSGAFATLIEMGSGGPAGLARRSVRRRWRPWLAGWPPGRVMPQCRVSARNKGLCPLENPRNLWRQAREVTWNPGTDRSLLHGCIVIRPIIADRARAGEEVIPAGSGSAGRRGHGPRMACIAAAIAARAARATRATTGAEASLYPCLPARQPLHKKEESGAEALFDSQRHQ